MSETMTRPNVCNGVDVAALMDTIEAVKANPAIAHFNFRLKNSWMGGDRNRSTIKDFTGACAEHRAEAQAFMAENGEPAVLLGQDGAPNPAEWVLHALAGCMTTTTAYHAAARGIAIEAIDSELEGDLDLRGFLGLSSDVRKGYSAINARLRVKTRASADAIRELTGFSPVVDIVGRSVPINLTVETY